MEKPAITSVVFSLPFPSYLPSPYPKKTAFPDDASRSSDEDATSSFSRVFQLLHFPFSPARENPWKGDEVGSWRRRDEGGRRGQEEDTEAEAVGLGRRSNVVRLRANTYLVNLNGSFPSKC
jgi:hypothetical protein